MAHVTAAQYVDKAANMKMMLIPEQNQSKRRHNLIKKMSPQKLCVDKVKHDTLNGSQNTAKCSGKFSNLAAIRGENS
jgi:hypothetical protein